MNTVLQSWMKATKTIDKNNKNIKKTKKNLLYSQRRFKQIQINIQDNAPLHIFQRKTEIGQLAKEMRT